jgi:hypothetical protein
VVPAGALAQVWRGTANQARLGQALEKARVGPFDVVARQAGELCQSAHRDDPIDAAVVLNATGTTSVIATSDPKDMRQLVRSLPSGLGAAITVLPV